VQAVQRHTGERRAGRAVAHVLCVCVHTLQERALLASPTPTLRTRHSGSKQSARVARCSNLVDPVNHVGVYRYWWPTLFPVVELATYFIALYRSFTNDVDVEALQALSAALVL